MVLIDGESQIQQFELAIISVQQIAACSAIFARTSHVLPQAVEGGTFLSISFGVFAIGLPNVILEGLDPIDFVGLLQRA